MMAPGLKVLQNIQPTGMRPGHSSHSRTTVRTPLQSTPNATTFAVTAGSPGLSICFSVLLLVLTLRHPTWQRYLPGPAGGLPCALWTHGKPQAWEWLYQVDLWLTWT